MDGYGLAIGRPPKYRALYAEKKAGSHTADQSIEQSLGLVNVHSRLQLKYGEDFGVKLDSFEGRGTVVSIQVPLRNKEEVLIQNEFFRS